MTRPFRLLPCLVILSALAVGCTKYDPFIGYAYDCECGNLELNGRETGLRLAEAELLEDGLWRYHIVTDVRDEQELEDRADPRDLSLTLTTEFNGSFTSLVIDAQDTLLQAQQVDAPSAIVPWTVVSANLQLEGDTGRHTMRINSIILEGAPGEAALTGTVTLSVND